MSGMFSLTKLFNGDLSKWDVSSVKEMDDMFYNVEAFNGDLSKWDVSIVIKEMDDMFYNAEAFNGDLSNVLVIYFLFIFEVIFFLYTV